MATTPLAQRLYDKVRADESSFRNEVAVWHQRQIESGFAYGGSAVDVFWQVSRNHLRTQVAAYFEWIEKEARDVYPSALRRESIEQCVGAVVNYGRVIRRIAVEKHRIMARLTDGDDLGRWDGVDDHSIADRGAKLTAALGLGKGARISERLNHLVNDHPWFFSLLSICSFVMSVLALWRSR